mmetsp:Transcript_40393/g.49209  ORF Transcript_40393/g.49209 Transcript_40393/m.49209 type:complete len:161 (+) Transcript_40393:146-628(+)|eukprot:CAMPEP_0172495812 /NCGR_PEP_ID=MMETSP1066-20121228/77842_1 /TAXON_ID=671091 /ORGANISM="Coscinodiscus wailesii, Strain CCMP2513" /LENGTH=160 /DNA_ID=CAMNT_0013267749 /DNA_START=139 /DNA_END=621 /DNA_ORIENTATION=-
MVDNFITDIRVTSILTVLLWFKVVITNLGLGGAKAEAGTRAPEDFYQKENEEASPEAKAAQDRSQRIVNNDLENIPYTMAMAWGSLFCIFLSEASGSGKSDGLATAHMICYSIFVAARYGHSISYKFGVAIARSLVYLVGLLCSFAIVIIGAVAAFEITV